MECRAPSARWIAAFLVVPLVLVMLLANGCASFASLTSAPLASTVTGRVSGPGGPIAGAQVTLTAYQNDRCVALARSTDAPSDRERRDLLGCISTAGAAISNDAGIYTFTNVRPGSYDLRITWALRQNEPVPSLPVFQQGEYVVAIVSNSDGTWTATAVSEIVTLSGQEDVVKDLTFHPPDR